MSLEQTVCLYEPGGAYMSLEARIEKSHQQARDVRRWKSSD